MDGASKFVRGDAIAGLLITFINIIGGIIIGVLQMGISFSEAAHSYTLLTVGDGLVSQIPALIVSTAAGLLVSKAGVSGSADKALVKQLTGYPQALGMASGVMAIMAFLPGMPPCRSWRSRPAPATSPSRSRGSHRGRTQGEARRQEGRRGGQGAAERRSRSPTALKIDELKIELGYALLPLVNAADGTDRLTDQIKALRRSLATEMGFVMPSVRILDNIQLDGNSYVIKVKEIEAGTRPDLRQPVHGHGPGRRAGGAARPPHDRADLRPAGDLDRGQRCARRRRSAAIPWSIRRPCCRPT